MKRASYREAIQWIADNDDIEFLNEEDPSKFLSITTSLVRDLFGVSEEKIIADLRREFKPTRKG